MPSYTSDPFRYLRDRAVGRVGRNLGEGVRDLLTPALAALFAGATGGFAAITFPVSKLQKTSGDPVTADGDPIGVVIDSSSFGNNIGQSGSARPIYSAADMAALLNGVDRYFNSGVAPAAVVTLLACVTIAFDPSTPLAAAQSVMAASAGAFGTATSLNMGVNTAGNMQAKFAGGTTQSRGSDSRGRKVVMAITWDGSAGRMYMFNGLEAGQLAGTFGASGFTTAKSIYCGAFNANDTPSNFFSGKATAFVAVKGKAASLQELTDMANALGYQPADNPLVTTLTTVSSATLPDAADSDTGKGPTCTGLARAADGTKWVSNDGRSNIADTTFNASLLHYSANFSTLLAEYTVAAMGIDATQRSMQGCAYESDTSLWFVLKSNQPGVVTSLIVNYNPATNSVLSQTTVSDNTNGIAYSAVRDMLMVSGSTGSVSWRKKSDPATAVGTTITTGFNLDQLSISGDRLLATAGVNNQNGHVYVYDISKALPPLLADLTVDGSTAIEGACLEGSVMTVLNDKYFHLGGAQANEWRAYGWPL